jgi:SHS2 domain-containing protein
MYETFDHTADLGLRAQEHHLDITLTGTDREYLLFDWLSELLYRWDTDHQLFSRFEVEVRDDGLRAAAWGEPLDASRHILGHEVKAITYHGLRVEPTADGWLAEVIVDI